MNQKLLRTGLAMIVLCCLSSFIGLQIQQIQPHRQCDSEKKIITRHDTLQFKFQNGCLNAEGKNDKINVLFLLW